MGSIKFAEREMPRKLLSSAPQSQPPIWFSLSEGRLLFVSRKAETPDTAQKQPK
jgi:hypothetical protein